jgi:signal transduction histidine kinase
MALVNKYIRPQDLIWLMLIAAVVALSPFKTPNVVTLLICLGLIQLLESNIALFATESGMVVAILIKVAIVWAVVGYTNGINSEYTVIFLIWPVISAAITLNAIGATAITALACGSYLSFLLFLDWSRVEITSEGVYHLGLRVIALPLIGFLTYQLAEANRVEARRYQAAAEQLAAANAHLREAEAAVRRSDRLAALGQLTAGLAHELRNPLGTMRASAEMLLKQTKSEDEVTRELAGFIASEVDRTNSLITRFLQFARPMHLRSEPTNLAEVIDRSVDELARHNPPYDVAVFKNYSPELRPIQLDAELMQRVFYNLLLNAAQATAPGGAITVKTRQVDGMAEIAVIDRGTGIDKEHLENIFNPFFTTKSDGVGLGLAIVSKIVDEHGGNITVDSEKGSGSVFRVYLPIAAEH